jgi:hypothetical protein
MRLICYFLERKPAMATTLPTGSISIVRIPEGEAPLWVRQAWVGIILPCDPYSGPSEDRGVLSGKHSKTRSDFSVPQSEAIGLLEEHNPEAAKWWKRRGFPKGDECFGFSKSDAVILSGVVPPNVHQVTDEMMGDRFR